MDRDTTKTERRDPPPPLQFAFPDCPVCEQEVGSDANGYLVCENCSAQWTKDDYDHYKRGEWFDETENLQQCPAERWSPPYGPHPEPRLTDRCVLHAGHDGDELGDHLNGNGYRFDARTLAELETQS